MRTVGAALGMVALMAAGAEGASLTATAGLGGVARPGRWTPVRVSVTNEDARLAGDIVIAWGDAVVRRRLVFDSPGTKQVELHVRTSDVEARVQIRFESDAATTAITVPIRVLRDEERFELCVTPQSPAVSPAGSCTASVTAAALPMSARGLEAVDDVAWPLGRIRPGAEQSAALRQWRTLKRLDASGDLSLTPQPARPAVSRGLPVRTGRGVLAIGALCLVTLALTGYACTRRPRRAMMAAAGVSAAVAAGCAAAMALGRVGPTRPLTVHHQSVLQQIPGTDAALLSMRAVAELPARGGAALRLLVGDGVIEPSVPRGRAIEQTDADGYPTLETTGGLGARRAFAAEAIVRGSWLQIDDSAGAVRITNRSPFAMEACRLAGGLRSGRMGVLPPGGVIEAARDADDGSEPALLGPVILCTTQVPITSLTEARRPVIMQGTTVIAAYLTPPSVEDIP